MDFHNDIIADLPTPEADEPSSLRQDILDELGDHLVCAAASESHEDEDEQSIRDRVLERFGDPAGIARQLWLDAIKGKLMLQKITTAFSATAAIGAIAGCVILWIAVSSARDAVDQALEGQRRDREQNAKANAALLSKLELLASKSKQPERSMDWNPVKIRLFLGEAGRRPAAGYEIKLDGHPYGEEKQNVDKTTDKQGVADFGLLRPGIYQASALSPSGLRCRFRVSVNPGRETDVTIRCPSQKLEKANVKLKVDLPQDLVDRQARVLVVLSNPYKEVGTHHWSQYIHWRYYLADGPNDARPHQIWEINSYSSNPQLDGTATLAIGNRDPNPPSWVTADYQAYEFYVLLKKSSRNIRRSFRQKKGTDWSIVARGLAYENNESPKFTPDATQDNVWTVSLPKKLLADVRKKFRAMDDAKRKAKEHDGELASFLKKPPATGTDFDKLTDKEKQAYIDIVRKYFSYLDERGNGDGRLQEREWDVSQRIKPIFVNAKIDLTREMGEVVFLKHYIRLVGIDDKTWQKWLKTNRGQ